MDSTRGEFLSSPRIILILSPIGALAVVYIIYDVFLLYEIFQIEYPEKIMPKMPFCVDISSEIFEIHHVEYVSSIYECL